MTRKVDDVALEHFIEAVQTMRALSNELGDISQFFKQPTPNAVLHAGSVVLDANGTYSHDWPVPFASVAASNPSISTTLTVAGDGLQSAAPGGTGVFHVAPGGFACRSLLSHTLTLYGEPGAVIDVTLYLRPQEPSASGGVSSLGTIANGTETTVDATVGGVQLLAASTTRRVAIVQNVHASAPFMLGLTGLTATTGLVILNAGDIARIRTRQALFGFRTTGTSSTALAGEIS